MGRMPGVVRIEGTRHVRVSRVGAIKTYESARKTHRHLERGIRRDEVVTVSPVGGRFFIALALALALEIRRAVVATWEPQKVVDVDAGLSTLHTDSTTGGELVLGVANPHHLPKAHK